MRNGLILVLALATAGCGVELLATTAIRGELEKENMSNMKKTLEHVKGTTSNLGVQQAIDAYRAENGENPPSLEALVPEYLTEIPTQADGTPYGYDPAQGVLLDGPVAQPARAAAPKESDFAKKQKIEAAIASYLVANGYYPTSLWALVPDYLPAYIKTNSGQDFSYNAETGNVFMPNPVAEPGSDALGAPAQASSPQRRVRERVRGGGGGPMGEVMTGIGIQNELNSMSNAGSSAARSRARGKAQDATRRQQQQQEAILNDMGQ